MFSLSDSLRPRGLSPTRLLCLWELPGKNPGVGCYFLLQGIFLTQGSNPCLLCLLHCGRILYLLNHWGSCLTQYLFQKIILGKQQYYHCQYSHIHLRVSVPPQGSLLGSDVYASVFVLVTLNIWRIFTSRRARPSSLFFFKWALVSLGPLYILINYRISLAVSKTKSIDF